MPRCSSNSALEVFALLRFQTNGPPLFPKPLVLCSSQTAEPEKILADPRLMATLDLSEPVALMMFGVLHFIPDDDDPYTIVNRLLTALPPGSYLAIQHPTRDFYAENVGADRSYRNAGISFQYRSREEFGRFVAGLELVPPGLVPMIEWRADSEPGPRPSATEAGAYAALGRKP